MTFPQIKQQSLDLLQSYQSIQTFVIESNSPLPKEIQLQLEENQGTLQSLKALYLEIVDNGRELQTDLNSEIEMDFYYSETLIQDIQFQVEFIQSRQSGVTNLVSRALPTSSSSATSFTSSSSATLPTSSSSATSSTSSSSASSQVSSQAAALEQKQRAQTLKEQDEIYELAECIDLYHKLLTSVEKTDPVQKFNALVDHYVTIKNPHFTLAESKKGFTAHLDTIKQDIDAIITSVEEVEKSKQQKMDAENIRTQTLVKLKNTFELKVNELQSAGSSASELNQVFTDLSHEDRQKLILALCGVIKQETGKETPRPDRFMRLSFAMWDGTNAQKLKALNSILPAETLVAAEASQAGKMRQKLEGALAIAAAVAAIKDLQKTLEMINKNLEDYDNLIENLFHISGKFVFKISGNEISNIYDCACLHLYHIIDPKDKNTSSSPLVYGQNAMTGVHGTKQFNAERKRAIQRAIVEIALETLENESESNSFSSSFFYIMNLLDNMQLDVKDLPPEVTRVSHLLFGQMFSIQKDQYEKKVSLTNPLDAQFKSDFGRVAFCKETPGVNPSVRIAAIQATREQLKKTWKV